MTEQRFGSYRAVRKLGEGGMGVVFEAFHEEIGKRAAVKVLHASLSRDPQLTARFLTEARAANLVQHPGLVNIFEFGRSPDGAAYLVMEFLEGETLRARLERLRRLPVADARRIVRQVASALAAAHEKQVVHRDLKPDNVMLVPEPELPGGERAKILDFGVAKVAMGGASMTQAGTILGTPAYMAPEQCMSATGVDEKADIYALGVMLYELLAGALPFESDSVAGMMLAHLQQIPPSVRTVSPDVPDALAELVARMLAKDPAARPGAGEVMRGLEASGTTAAVPAVPASAVPPSLQVPVVARRAAFVHRGSPANTVENFTYLDHPLLNGDPSAVLLVTANWNPGGQGGTYNNHHTGVWIAGNGRWSVYNEDRIPMPTTLAWNCLVDSGGFVHRATPANIVNNWTIIDHPAVNGRPDALLLVTANWNPGALGGTYNNHALGVWYTNGRWAIYNQDRSPMPVAAAFNVVVAPATFCHRVSPASLAGGNATFIDHPTARGNPNAIILVTANWNPGGQGGLYHDHAVGVYYGGDRWAIFNQDLAAMPTGVAFNVLVTTSG